MTADETPLPIRLDLGDPSALAPALTPAAVAPTAPTAAFVLQQIAANDGPWFPARFAADAGVPRDSLDDPLAALRAAGLVLATEWVRGVGQGYALTAAGRAAATDPDALDRLARGAPAAEVAALAGAIQAGPIGAPAAEVDAPDDPDPALRPPVAVPGLLMANAVWFFICAVWGIRWGLTLADSLWRGHPDVLHRFGAVRGPDLLAGEWWRLFTCCFVHVGALHLLLNLFALAMMGPLAELLWGRGRLLLIYAFSGLGGSALAMAIRPDSLLAGASGAIWGIQMSLFVWLWAFRDRLPSDVAADWLRRLTVVFLLNAVGSLLPNVSWEGHLGGGLAGLLTAGLLNVARSGGRGRRLLAWLLLTLLPVVCVAGLAGAMGAKGMPGWQKLHQRLAAEREHERAQREYERAQREVLEKLEQWRAAQNEYVAEVDPRLAALKPTAPHPLKIGDRYVNLLADEWQARAVLRNPARTAEQTAAARAKLQARKATADEIAARSARPPAGVDALDRRYARAHRFATARARSFELLLLMLDMNGPPADPTWKAWEAARLEAEDRWGELKPK